MPDRIDLTQADDLRDVAQRAVAALAGGGLVGLAVDGGWGVLASALHPAAVERLDRFGRAGTGAGPDADRHRPTILLRDAAELADWADVGSPSARRLPNRAWPGPVTLRCSPSDRGLLGRLPAGAATGLSGGDGRVAFQVPADGLTRAILGLTAGPVIQADAPAQGWADLVLSDVPGLILDPGEPRWDLVPTIVQLDDRDEWRVVRPGVVPERVLLDWSGTILLFVCTGNTCRSPMAEALCRAVLARRFGCGIDDLGRHGYAVGSAGVAAGDGRPAAANAVSVVQGRGGSLRDHRSRQVSADLVRRADHILAMTWDHLDALLDLYPEAADRVRLLDPAGDDIDDPVGMDEATYKATARVIEQHLEALLQELGL